MNNLELITLQDIIGEENYNYYKSLDKDEQIIWLELKLIEMYKSKLLFIDIYEQIRNDPIFMSTLENEK